MANKILEIQKKEDQANNILESIPEWKLFIDEDLNKVNEIEQKPLGSDPRKKDLNQDDDFFDSRHGSDRFFNFKDDKKDDQDEDDDNTHIIDLDKPPVEDEINEDTDMQKYFSNGHQDDLRLEDLQQVEKIEVKAEYDSNQFWKMNEQYQIDDLLLDYQ